MDGVSCLPRFYVPGTVPVSAENEPAWLNAMARDVQQVSFDSVFGIRSRWSKHQRLAILLQSLCLSCRLCMFWLFASRASTNSPEAKATGSHPHSCSGFSSRSPGLATEQSIQPQGSCRTGADTSASATPGASVTSLHTDADPYAFCQRKRCRTGR
ncbi:unnamed protein product [Symbiodinium pilosum]|uniref:Uncharacterized protein n=1 Tax=Symbiodinium pilosum TaxID=2952 RepID=A0A812KX76_SYMPI|nr:unnamed protein product [Symbiodinium pilosum]